MMLRNRLLRLGAMALILLSASELLAQGSLMVSPKRIILNDRKRNDVLDLYNSGEDTTSYEISFKHFEMREDGSFKDVDTTIRNYTSADSMLRFFPLQVTLAPHESQAVKIRFMKPQVIQTGEYRSHLYFRGVQRVRALGSVAGDTNKTISLSLHAIFGLSIPVIVRIETKPAKVGLANMTVTAPDSTGSSTVSADIDRSGDESCYGSFIVTHIAQDGGITQLTVLKGIAVYVPLLRRRVSIQFKIPAGLDFTTGTLRLEYQTLTDNPKETTLASAELPLKKG